MLCGLGIDRCPICSIRVMGGCKVGSGVGVGGWGGEGVCVGMAG